MVHQQARCKAKKDGQPGKHKPQQRYLSFDTHAKHCNAKSSAPLKQI